MFFFWVVFRLTMKCVQPSTASEETLREHCLTFLEKNPGRPVPLADIHRYAGYLKRDSDGEKSKGLGNSKKCCCDLRKLCVFPANLQGWLFQGGNHEQEHFPATVVIDMSLLCFTLGHCFWDDIKGLGIAKASRLTRDQPPTDSNSFWLERRWTHRPALDLREWIHGFEETGCK